MKISNELHKTASHLRCRGYDQLDQKRPPLDGVRPFMGSVLPGSDPEWSLRRATTSP